MTSLFHNQNQQQQTPVQSSSPNLLQTLATTTITESLFGSAWNNTWLPHPTRDVTSSLYPWTEDACRDFLLQTALSMCCGARPSPSACSFSLAQLTPISQPSPLDSASLMSSVGGALNFSPMSETPSARQRKNEERLLRVFFVDLFEAKKRQFEEQNQKQQQQEDDESKKMSEDDKEATEKKESENSQEKEKDVEAKKKKKQLPPKMTPKELCQAFLPSAFWMQSDALHPFAISCAWRIAFNVQPVEDILLQAQDEIRREVFSPEEYDYEFDENDEKQKKNEENVSAASKNQDAAEDNNKNIPSSSSEIWTNLYDSALEDRSLAATHIRGIISRKLTLDRFSVRELCFIWHLVSGPRSTAMKWFRKYLKNVNETASSNIVDNVTTPASSSKTPANNNNNNNNVSSSVVSSSASTTTTAAAGSPLSPSLQKQTITLQQTGLYPKNINLVFAPLVLNCIVKKDSLMFEMRALYFGVLEQHNIGKERRVIPNPNASENTQQKEDDNDADQKSKTTAEEQTSSKTSTKPKKKQVTIETPSQQLRKQAPARRTRETTEEDDEENNRKDEEQEQDQSNKKKSSSKEEKEQKSSTKTGNTKKGTTASSSTSSLQQQQQQQPSFGFLFGNTPINPYYDRNEEMKLKQQKSLQQRGYRLIVYDSDTNTSTNTSLMAEQGFTSSSNSNLLNNNSSLMMSNESNNTASFGALSSRRRNTGNAFSSHDDHHQQKPEIELSTADEVVTNENSNTSKTSSSSSATNATTLISVPVANKNSSSVSSALPRHSSSAWQLLSVVNLQKQKQQQLLRKEGESAFTKADTNLPPVIWREYYQRCAELIKNEGLMNTSSINNYFEKKF